MLWVSLFRQEVAKYCQLSRKYKLVPSRNPLLRLHSGLKNTNSGKNPFRTADVREYTLHDVHYFSSLLQTHGRITLKIRYRSRSESLHMTHFLMLEIICATYAKKSIHTSQQFTNHYDDVLMSAMASQITSLAIVYSTVYSRCRSKRELKLRVTGLCEGNSSGTSKFLTQRASYAENVSI